VVQWAAPVQPDALRQLHVHLALQAVQWEGGVLLLEAERGAWLKPPKLHNSEGVSVDKTVATHAKRGGWRRLVPQETLRSNQDLQPVGMKVGLMAVGLT